MDNVALWLLIIIFAVPVLKNLKAGTLPTWFQAKFFNAGDRPPAWALGGLVDDAIAAAGGGASPGSWTGTAGFDAKTLVNVNGARLSPGFASRWRPLVAAAKADGINLTGGGYRSNAEQKALYAKNCPGGRCKVPTAVPGTSRHETGDAIDVNLSAPGGRASKEYSWLSRRATEFGVYNLPSEPWHWSVDGH